MNKKFNSIRYYKDFTIGNTEKIRINKLLKLIGTNKKVLDIGCGDGFISELILKNNNDVYGIEIAEDAIKKARNKGITIYDLDLNLDWCNNLQEKFDVVFAGEIIEHVFDTDKFLKNIHRVLKKDGYIVLSTPNVASLGRRILLLLGKNPLIETTARSYDAGHIRYFTYKTLKKLLEENNFKMKYFTSDCINFNANGLIKSKLGAIFFPKMGRSLIIKAVKK